MERLTKKYECGYAPELPPADPLYDRKQQFIDAYKSITNKLGQYEDIEKEFEIDSIEDLRDRLTKYKFLANHEMSCVDTNAYNLMLEDLNKYRSVEEELGIDLITMFEALKNGIWTKGGYYTDILQEEPTFVKNPEISVCSYYESDKDYNLIKHEENVWCIYTYDYEIMIRQTMLKDYGKTWALTKEELE